MSPGMAYGELGPTHHSIEDLAWTRAIHNLHVLVPADPAETRAAMRWAVASGQPTFMRIGRHKVPAVMPEDTRFAAGRATTLRPGRDVTLVAIGTMVSRALDAARQLEAMGIDARVVNAASVKPLDAETILAAARETRGIVTVEEATVQGGLGAAVAELVSQRHPVRMRILGVTDFAPTGNADFLLAHFGLTADNIAARAAELARMS